jgi:hypothetical protein
MCWADEPVCYNDLLGTWISKPSGKKLKFYWDNTLFLRVQKKSYYRGNFVLQVGKKPLFFLLTDNHRVKCPVESLQKHALAIGGKTPLAGVWIKKDNKYRAYW